MILLTACSRGPKLRPIIITSRQLKETESIWDTGLRDGDVVTVRLYYKLVWRALRMAID